MLDVCSNRGAKREMGGHRFQMGEWAPLAPSLATALNLSIDVFKSAVKYQLILVGTMTVKDNTIGWSNICHLNFG